MVTVRNCRSCSLRSASPAISSASVSCAATPAAAATAQSRADLVAGVKSLGADFAAASEADRVRKLESIESSPFFQAVRLKTVMVLYDNPIAWAHFGYEGEAFSKGGYLTRGFNDLKWLPEVPLDASGPMPV